MTDESTFYTHQLDSILQRLRCIEVIVTVWEVSGSVSYSVADLVRGDIDAIRETLDSPAS